MVNWSRIPPKYFQRSVWGVVWTAAVVHGVSTTGEHSKQKKYGILIIGKTGNGKSSIANAILGQQKFAVGSTMASTTLKVQSEQTERDNCLWTVVDTPDPVNSELDTKQLKEEIQKWKQMTASFPSAILLAVRCDVRYTAEEYDIYKKIKNAWADKSFLDNLIIVFTFGDRQDKDLAEELKTVCPELKNVLKDSNNNYVLFNNKKTEGSAGRRWPLGGFKQHNQHAPPTLLDTNGTWFDEPSRQSRQPSNGDREKLVEGITTHCSTCGYYRHGKQ